MLGFDLIASLLTGFADWPAGDEGQYDSRMTLWTLIDEQRTLETEVGDDLRFDPAVLGWERKSQGLCRGDVCVPVPGDTHMDLVSVARLLGRPLMMDSDEHVASLGASAADRASALSSGMAPEFELPDVIGTMHRLSDHRGRKVALYSWASW